MNLYFPNHRLTFVILNVTELMMRERVTIYLSAFSETINYDSCKKNARERNCFAVQLNVIKERKNLSPPSCA
jgi:hypothetical protein